MPDLEITDVPDDVVRRLERLAATAGQSLEAFLRDRLLDLAEFPSLDELIDRIRSRAPYDGPSSADEIRKDRDSR